MKIIKSLARYRSRYSEGWDYTCYEAGADLNKMIKILNPVWRQIWHRKFEFWNIFPILIGRSRKKHMIKTKESLKKTIEHSPEIFANTRFIGTSYVQDRVQTVRQHIKGMNEQELDVVMKKLFYFYQRCWVYGFSDTTFKFSSYGITPSGEIVILDISELTFSKKRIKSMIESRKWMQTLDFLLLPRKVQAFDVELTGSNDHLSRRVCSIYGIR